MKLFDTTVGDKFCLGNSPTLYMRVSDGHEVVARGTNRTLRNLIQYVNLATGKLYVVPEEDTQMITVQLEDL